MRLRLWYVIASWTSAALIVSSCRWDYEVLTRGEGGSDQNDGAGGGGAGGAQSVEDRAEGGAGGTPLGGGGGTPPGPDEIEAAGTAHRGSVFLLESFDDSNFVDRGWYDDPDGTIEGSYAGTGFRCDVPAGSTTCDGGAPGRIGFGEQEAVYLSFWVRYSAGNPGDPIGGLATVHLLTNVDNDLVGPGRSHLTAYIQAREGKAELALSDYANVDPDCVLLSDGSFIGCDGDFDSYAFGEQRSVNACNGVFGAPTTTSCEAQDGGYFSLRAWESEDVAFAERTDSAGGTEFHLVEALVALNSVADGVGQADGVLKLWVDGELVVERSNVVLRTGTHPNMAFDHILVAPYLVEPFPDGQWIEIDELVVAQGIP